ncbi:MAG: RecB family exonuclease, partial [Desulfovibrionaceae bacterium]
TAAPVPVLFHAWEAAVRAGGKLQDPTEWVPAWGEPPLDDIPAPGDAEALRREILDVCLRGFEAIHGLGDLARALAGLAGLLARRGAGLWRANLIDAEYLSRLRDAILPELAAGALAERPLPASSCFAVLRQLTRDERVSFEPEPLLGLQVLGMLETRLLRFDTVLILDAIEERLPGGSPFDPLLPDPLRPLLGLPDARERDAVAAYNFQRLLMGARRAVICWQDGVRPGLFDAKSVRSRFVEELLWEREKARGKLLAPGDGGPLSAVRFRAGAMPRPEVGPLPRTPALDRLVREKLEHGISLSALDDYLRCPRRFYFHHLARVQPPTQVQEAGDRGEFGSAVHAALQAFVQPHLGRPVNLAELDAPALFGLFERHLGETAFFRQMPFDLRAGLLAAGRARLGEFLAAQQPTLIRALETPLTADLEIAGTTARLKGQFDRLDERAGGLMILDYKTGALPQRRGAFLADPEALAAVQDPPEPGPDGDPELLARVREATGGVQLPGYLWMHWRATGLCAADAAWVDLKGGGKEEALLGKHFDEDERRAAVQELAPALLGFVLRHLLAAPVFAAPSEAAGARSPCRYCDFNGPCGAQGDSA